MQNIPVMVAGDGTTRADDGGWGSDIVAKTAAYTIQPAEASKVFTNGGAGASVTFTLPPAKRNVKCRFLKVTAAQDLVVAASGGAKVQGSTANKKYQNVTTTEIGCLTLVSDGTDWFVSSEKGTWSINNA